MNVQQINLVAKGILMAEKDEEYVNNNKSSKLIKYRN